MNNNNLTFRCFLIQKLSHISLSYHVTTFLVEFIHRSSDAAKLQEDVTALEGRGHRWQMSFNQKKVHIYPNLEQETAIANILYSA